MRKMLLVVSAVYLTVTSAAVAQSSSTVCKDGSATASAGRGTCSGHGGIDAKATKKVAAAANKAGRDAAKAQRTAATQSRASGEVTGNTVSCRDGSTSVAGRGACSHHGGVGVAVVHANTAPRLPASVPASSPARARSQAQSHAPSATGGSGAGEDNNPVGAIAQCKDGMYSHAAHRRGACSRHGGVANWIGQ